MSIDQRLAEYLGRKTGLLAWKAGHDEDVIQEGRIAVWKALKARPDATDSFLDQAATWAIRDMQRGDAATGEQRRPGVKADPLRSSPAMLDGTDAVVHNLFKVPAVDNDIAAHEREIHAAVAELPEAHRKYVVARFWGDMDRNEIGRVLGRNPGNLSTTWRTQIQPRLASSLAHLESAA